MDGLSTAPNGRKAAVLQRRKPGMVLKALRTGHKAATPDPGSGSPTGDTAANRADLSPTRLASRLTSMSSFRASASPKIPSKVSQKFIAAATGRSSPRSPTGGGGSPATKLGHIIHHLNGVDDGSQSSASPSNLNRRQLSGLADPAPGGLMLKLKAQAKARKLAAVPAMLMLRKKKKSDDEAAAAEEDGLSEEEKAKKRRRQEILRRGVRILRAAARAGLWTRKVRVDSRRTDNSKRVWFSGQRRDQQREESAEGGSLAEAWSIMQQGSRDGNRMMLPTAADLSDLPRSLCRTFTGLATETLRKFAYPRVLLWLRKRERRRGAERHQPGCPELTSEILRRQVIFKNCPPEVLEDLPSMLVYTGFESGEYLIHEGENAGSGIYFLMTGEVEVLKKKTPSKKSLGPSNTKILAQLRAVMCVGEFSFLTEEPRMASIRAVTHCDCWVLRKEDWANFVNRIPSELFSSVVDVAFATRKQTMHMSYPLREGDLRRSPIFRACPQEMLVALLRRLTPYAVPKNFLLGKADDAVCDRVLFLQNGRCGVLRPVERTSASGCRRKSVTHVSTVCAPCVLGDTAVLYGVPLGDSYSTLSTCDFWVLSKEHFDQSLRQYPGVQSCMMAEARRQRQGQLATQHNLFKDYIQDIPLLRDNCPRQHLKKLVRRFTAKVYKPMSIVCCTAQFADRVVVLYKGRVRVGESSQYLPKTWYRGEAIGFTCIVPHRWAQVALAVEVIECLELMLEDYDAFLQEAGLRRGVVEATKRLMFPNAFPQDEVVAVQEQVAHLRTPAFYPVSWSWRVNLHQHGFAECHYGEMLKPRGAREYEFPSSRSVIRPRRSPKLPMLDDAPREAGTPREAAPASPAAPPTLPSLRPPQTANSVTPRTTIVAGAQRRRGWARASQYLWRKPLPECTCSGSDSEARSLVSALRGTGRRTKTGFVADDRMTATCGVSDNSSRVHLSAFL